MRIILASQSPRRRELLGQIGLEFEIRVSDVEETITTTIPHKLVEELSAQKAGAVFDELIKTNENGNSEASHGNQDILIIGADTVVSIDGKILGKPADEREAAEMLRTLSGRTHQVYTGVTLLYCPTDVKLPMQTEAGEITASPTRTETGVITKSFHEKTDVIFFPMTEEEIAGYVATGDCLDKAGAYGIQGFCARYIKGIAGDYNNVVGLPVGRLFQEVKVWLSQNNQKEA